MDWVADIRGICNHSMPAAISLSASGSTT